MVGIIIKCKKQEFRKKSLLGRIVPTRLNSHLYNLRKKAILFLNSLTRKDHSSKYEQLSRGQLGLIYLFNEKIFCLSLGGKEK